MASSAFPLLDVVALVSIVHAIYLAMFQFMDRRFEIRLKYFAQISLFFQDKCSELQGSDSEESKMREESMMEKAHEIIQLTEMAVYADGGITSNNPPLIYRKIVEGRRRRTNKLREDARQTGTTFGNRIKWGLFLFFSDMYCPKITSVSLIGFLSSLILAAATIVFTSFSSTSFLIIIFTYVFIISLVYTINLLILGSCITEFKLRTHDTAVILIAEGGCDPNELVALQIEMMDP